MAATGLAYEAMEHWRVHLPRMYKELKEKGILWERALEAATLTQEEASALRQQGMPEPMIWELVRENHVFLPEESEEEEPDTESLEPATEEEKKELYRKYLDQKDMTNPLPNEMLDLPD